MGLKKLFWFTSAVGIATGYSLDDWGVGVESRWGQEFSLRHVVQTNCGAHPASYPMGTGVKRRRSEA
jgi:hypothetical protein